MQRLSQLLSGGYLILAALISLITVVNGPLGVAPFPVGPSREPVVITIQHGTEKQEWLTAAVGRFNATNQRVRGRPIQIQLAGGGSREIVTRIFENRSQPTAIIPASSTQLDLLRNEWQARNPANRTIVLEGADAPQPLVFTPLVVVSWQDRGAALWPQGVTDTFWNEVHDAVADPKGWETLNHPEWGSFVKFAHTSPESSNSGLQTLVLLASAYHNKASGLTVQDVNDPGFQEWLAQIEDPVGEFGPSTGTFMQNMVLFGPSRYDAIAVYENVALQSIDKARLRGWPNLHIYYPPGTLLSDHPFAILDAPWVDADQRAAAALFRGFLLSQPTQQLALEYGFRPANTQVAVDSPDPANPFVKYQPNGAQIDVAQQVEMPPADVLSALIEQWRRANP